MKHWHLGLLGVSVAGLLFGAAVRSGSRVEGVYCSDPVWDLGVIDSRTIGQKFSHEFLLTNTTRDKLPFGSIQSSCGCLVPDAPREIAAHQDLPLTVSFHPPPSPGQFNKQIAVSWGGDRPGVLMLRVTGYIEPAAAFYVVPAVIHFGTVTAGETAERTIDVCSYSTTPMTAARLSEASNSVICRRAERIPELNRVRLHLQFTPQSSESYVHGKCLVALEDGDDRAITVPFKAIVKSRE